MTEPVIVCQSVERQFGETRVLRGVDLTVEKATLVALYGPSGSGKTTLLNLIGALDTPTRGHIYVQGNEVSALRERRRAKLRRKHFGFIFQNYTLMPTYTATENIDLALRLAGIGYFERRRRARSTLETVGLSAWADHMPEELSGGQRQRVAIARALAARPAVILADEPTSGLDTRTAKRILALFRHFAHEYGTTFVIVSHDPMVAEHVDAAYDLNDGILTRRTSTPHFPAPADAQTGVLTEGEKPLVPVNSSSKTQGATPHESDHSDSLVLGVHRPVSGGGGGDDAAGGGGTANANGRAGAGDSDGEPHTVATSKPDNGK